MSHRMHSEVREQLAGLSSLLTPCGSQRLNSGPLGHKCLLYLTGYIVFLVLCEGAHYPVIPQCHLFGHSLLQDVYGVFTLLLYN